MRRADVLIIGSGIAGLTLAYKAAEAGLRVIVVTKKACVDSATNLAQGGVAAVLAEGDSFAAHEADTLRSGAGLCHQDVVRMVVREGPARVRELLDLGVRFKLDRETGGFDLGREGGHSHRRVFTDTCGQAHP